MISIKQCFSQFSGNPSTLKSVIHQYWTSKAQAQAIMPAKTKFFVTIFSKTCFNEKYKNVCNSNLVSMYFSVAVFMMLPITIRNTEQPVVEKMCVLAKCFTYTYTVRCEDR